MPYGAPRGGGGPAAEQPKLSSQGILIREAEFADKPVAVGNTGGERLFKDVQ